MAEPAKQPSNVLNFRIARSIRTAAEAAAKAEGVSLGRWVNDTITARLVRERRIKL